MLILSPVIMWTSLGNAVIPSIFVPMMNDCMTQFETSEQKNKHALLALVGLGIGEIIGASSFGYVQDNFSNKVSALFCLLLSSVGVAISFSFAQVYSFSLWFAGPMMIAWGIQDGASNCLASCILGFQFDSKTTPFSVYKAL